MTILIVVYPDVLLATECCKRYGADKCFRFLVLFVVEGDSNGVRRGFVAIDEHQRPLTVGPVDGVGGHKLIAVGVFDFARCWEHVVHAGVVLHPVEINHPCAVVERCVAEDVVVGVGDEIGPGRPAKACVVKRFRLYRRMVKDGAAAFEKRADVVGQPDA